MFERREGFINISAIDREGPVKRKFENCLASRMIEMEEKSRSRYQEGRRILEFHFEEKLEKFA